MTKQHGRNGFKKGSGCFPCELCRKLTRQTDNNTFYCEECYNQMENENQPKKAEVIKNG